MAPPTPVPSVRRIASRDPRAEPSQVSPRSAPCASLTTGTRHDVPRNPCQSRPSSPGSRSASPRLTVHPELEDPVRRRLPIAVIRCTLCDEGAKCLRHVIPPRCVRGWRHCSSNDAAFRRDGQHLGRRAAEVDSDCVVHADVLVSRRREAPIDERPVSDHCHRKFSAAPSVTDHPPSSVRTWPVTKRTHHSRNTRPLPPDPTGCPMRPPSSGCFTSMKPHDASSLAARWDIGVSTDPPRAP